ncbi:hypothetical protein JK358_36180 [Nocardia sp. 2]|uniref:Galactose oxidase n=1 Tax=Nocardia acididurans TaxID=2802282 RepID=A0ABS1MH10_9NOCA|nr:hypothetical protein [Nocardia acididurans]MBL1079852.1 hypothetical protein [Nocardia acididurans]
MRGSARPWRDAGRARAALLALSLLALAGCAAPVTRTDPEWTELSAPAAGARVLAVVPFEGKLLLLGSVPGPDGRSPAAWTTSDGDGWNPVRIQPESGYGAVAELVSAGVGDRIVALGQASGGAHFHPRMTVWAGDAAALRESPQVVEQFGGPRALGVYAAAAHGGTGVLVGGWTGGSGRPGATVWVTADGLRWDRLADDPALAAGSGETTGASGGAATPSGYLVVGNSIRGMEYQPLEWISADGRAWERKVLPGSGVADRVGCDDRGCVVVGKTVGARPQLQCWPSPSTVVTGPQDESLDITQVVLRAARVLITIRAGGTARLLSAARDCTGLREIPLPAVAPKAFLGALGDGILLATTDPAGDSRIWLHTNAF